MDIHSHPLLERDCGLSDAHVIVDRDVYLAIVQNSTVFHLISQKRYIEAATALKAIEEYEKNKKER